MAAHASSLPVMYSVVVAVYNSVVTLPELALRIDKVLKLDLGQTYELIFVNDGSINPETMPALEKLQVEYPEVKVVQLARNFGQHAATLCGIRYAQGQFIITIDDDLQHLPEELPQLLALQQYDVVFANFEEPQQPFLQRIGSKLKAWLDCRLFQKPTAVQFSSFRLISRPVADYLATCQVPYPYLPALILQATNSVAAVKVAHAPRPAGKSGYTLGKQLGIIGNMLINHSTVPLKSISLCGILIAGFSFMAMLFILLRKFFVQVNTTGWTSLIVTLLFIGGLLLLAVGIIGEYLSRTLAGVEKRPMYVVRKTAGFNHD
ncbi:glycosyltransferase family 2 protein [Adhaeribacter soli]|uniref:Glycosyltransferase family 2 protein n=1 Tax=Adhaeribacter soli TaxID=2607655 RepID=A0A5N1J229_9BACT|nr:glycosyltransferase family 2 protein [Adhaeribacter soli]KAA9340833.1 glycosyltransferase family 2 protein [Adhaeribacter soli]